jgi:hypothetical protein
MRARKASCAQRDGPSGSTPASECHATDLFTILPDTCLGAVHGPSFPNRSIFWIAQSMDSTLARISRDRSVLTARQMGLAHPITTQSNLCMVRLWGWTRPQKTRPSSGPVSTKVMCHSSISLLSNCRFLPPPDSTKSFKAMRPGSSRAHRSGLLTISFADENRTQQIEFRGRWTANPAASDALASDL